MSIYHNGVQIARAYIGNTEIAKAYGNGVDLAFTAGPPPVGGPATVDPVQYDYTSETTSVQVSISLSPDGFIAHLIGGISGVVTMFQYTLGTAFNLSTMAYTGTNKVLFASGENVFKISSLWISFCSCRAISTFLPTSTRR